MAFLTKDELKTVSDMNVVNIIIDLDDTIVEDIINESIDIMKGYLSRFYDIDKIFNAEGSERKLSVLKRLKDIVIYEVYERHTRDTNAVAARRYDAAIEWLEKTYTGEQGDRTLPAKPEDTGDNTGSTGDTRFGGNMRYDSKY